MDPHSQPVRLIEALIATLIAYVAGIAAIATWEWQATLVLLAKARFLLGI
jgi:hypothetical protein